MSKGPYKDVHSAQGPVNSIVFCIGENLTVPTRLSVGYPTLYYNSGGGGGEQGF
jgi:hypothetical protein